MQPISVAAKIVAGKGVYTEIVSVDAPAEATPGATVDIVVRIKNLYSSTIGIMVGGALEYGVSPWPTIDFPQFWTNVAGGATYSFRGSFVMPNRDVMVHAYSYYYSAGWYFDDQREVKVKQVMEAMFSNMSVSYRRVP